MFYPTDARMQTFGILLFPGSNCDHDAFHVISEVMGQKARFIWHKDEHLGDVDAVILPGGFSYGDYLRVGAIARFSPIMKDLVRFANEGGLVIGICNGFQILCESGLLPGALIRNENLRFVCKDVHLRVDQVDTPFTNTLAKGDVIELHVAHGDGNYFASPDEIQQLEDNQQIVFRYASPEGELTKEANPNGSLYNIAGIVNKQRNVMGLMPHPERCAEELIGSGDGIKLFESMIAHVTAAIEE